MAKTTTKDTVKKAKSAAKPAAVEISPIPESPLFFERPDKFNQVNHSLTKIDAMGLVCGQQKYVDDIDLPDPALRARLFPRPGAEGFNWSVSTTRKIRSRLVDLETDADIHEPGRPGELRLTGPGISGAP